MESHVLNTLSIENGNVDSAKTIRDIVMNLWEDTAHTLTSRVDHEHTGKCAEMSETHNMRNYAIPLPVLANAMTSEAEQRQAFLCELPELFAGRMQLDEVWQPILKRLLAVIPGADRGAFLICDRESNTLLLKAYVSSNGPVVSKEFARRAMLEGKGFIWRRSESPEEQAPEVHGETAMYMPLLWQGEVAGVMCIDSSQFGVRFTPDDLQLLATVAYWAAMAIANHRLQEDGRQQAKVLDRLMTNFSPNVRGRLLERARHGKLRPGGKSRKSPFCMPIFEDSPR